MARLSPFINKLRFLSVDLNDVGEVLDCAKEFLEGHELQTVFVALTDQERQEKRAGAITLAEPRLHISAKTFLGSHLQTMKKFVGSVDHQNLEEICKGYNAKSGSKPPVVQLKEVLRGGVAHDFPRELGR